MLKLDQVLPFYSQEKDPTQEQLRAILAKSIEPSKSVTAWRFYLLGATAKATGLCKKCQYISSIAN